MGRAKTSGDNLTREQKKHRVLELRMAGMTYRAIADNVGVSTFTAHKWVTDALEEYRHNTEEKTQELIEIEDARIERLIRAHWASAIKGNATATDKVLKLMERKAKLHGLDAPVRRELSGPGGGPIEVEGGGLSSLLTAIEGMDKDGGAKT